MTKLAFENNLPHQLNAIEDVLSIFNGVEVTQPPSALTEVNPTLVIPQFKHNIEQAQMALPRPLRQHTANPILDIEMETGTGKTYTYTRTLFELSQRYGVYKFVVFVPTLAIKSGTKAFFEQSRERFYDDFGKHIQLHEVSSQKKSKSNKQSAPVPVLEFVKSTDTRKIHILLINAGMLNSTTMDKMIEQDVFADVMGTSFDAISAVKPICIVDEPHKIKIKSKTWQKLQQCSPQFILRFGATFGGRYENLIHRLTSLDAFSQNLVKGVNAYVMDFKHANDSYIKFKGLTTSKHEAVFELITKQHKKEKTRSIKRTLAKSESLGALHPEIQGTTIININARKNFVALSNGLFLNKNEVISPYSFSKSLQMDMVSKALDEHLEIERKLLTRQPRIKPLTLFFIDDIDGYRGDSANHAESLKSRFEQLLVQKVKAYLAQETDPFYKAYLEKTLSNISATHGGYFSKDNSTKDEDIIPQVNEILHDKLALLSLDNPRRFIFSKWTLKEGWDNPNVFQICKLRSSGSETSKLQEVGRGLRLPVNEFGHREKQEQFYLNYFVDFSEHDFVDKLKQEINEQSSFEQDQTTDLTIDLKDKIRTAYPKETNRTIANTLFDLGAVNDNDEFINDGFEIMVSKYRLAFPNHSINQLGDKIKLHTDTSKHKTKIRKAQYQELKSLWEAINRRVILQYDINSEAEFEELLKDFFQQKILKSIRYESGVSIQRHTLKIDFGQGVSTEMGNSELLGGNYVATKQYAEFSQQLAQVLSVNLFTLHKALATIKDALPKLQNAQGIRLINQEFKQYLLRQCINRHQVRYQSVQTNVHPTAFTRQNGEPKDSIETHNIGRYGGDIIDNEQYLFDKLFFDSELECNNIQHHLEEIIVFTKIPKNTINIPVAGGGTYSPDFAYVLKERKGTQTLNLIVETKDTQGDSLRDEERQKIQYAQKLFEHLSSDEVNQDIKVEFKTQFENERIETFIRELMCGRLDPI